MLALLSPIGPMTAALDTGISNSAVPSLHGTELAQSSWCSGSEQQLDLGCELHRSAQRHTVLVNAI